VKDCALVCCLCLAVAACDAGPEPRSPLPQPSPVAPAPPEPSPPTPPSPPPLPPGTEVVGLGEQVKDSVSAGADKNYAVTVPAEGTLIVHLTWIDTGGGFTLRLKVNSNLVEWQCGEFSPWPVEGRAPVVAGQQVSIAVGVGAGCWDYSRIGPREATGYEFVMTTSMD
jgi:hypothetical protein